MSLDKTQPWQTVTFRTDEKEYLFTHAVHIKTVGIEFTSFRYELEFAICGKRLPDVMINDILSFESFINSNWLSCPRCQVEVNKMKLK